MTKEALGRIAPESAEFRKAQEASSRESTQDIYTEYNANAKCCVGIHRRPYRMEGPVLEEVFYSVNAGLRMLRMFLYMDDDCAAYFGL